MSNNIDLFITSFLFLSTTTSNLNMTTDKITKGKEVTSFFGFILKP